MQYREMVLLLLLLKVIISLSSCSRIAGMTAWSWGKTDFQLYVLISGKYLTRISHWCERGSLSASSVMDSHWLKIWLWRGPLGLLSGSRKKWDSQLATGRNQGNESQQPTGVQMSWPLPCLVFRDDTSFKNQILPWWHSALLGWGGEGTCMENAGENGGIIT